MLARLLSAALVILVAPSWSSAQEAQGSADGSEAGPQEGEYAEVRQSILEQVNQFRKSEELGAVKTDDTLQKTAKKFAEFMARTGKYGHRADGRTPAERATAEGYDYCIVLENIAYRSGRLEAADLGKHFFEGWQDSPEHRRNMLNANVTQMGVGLAKTADGETVYAVQMFGRPESEKIKITVVNRADMEVKMSVDDDSSSQTFELPPRGILTLSRCGTTEVKLPEADVVQEVSESVRLVITRGDQGLRLDREDE